MAHNPNQKSPDPRTVYADIIDHPHWQSKSRPHMSLYDRAAQFSPFAALTGYDDMVSEEARIVERRVEPGEDEVERLNRELSLIHDTIEKGTFPTVSITYFVPDPLKVGGRYETSVEKIKKIDSVRGKLVLKRVADANGPENKQAEIDIRDIIEIKSIPE